MRKIITLALIGVLTLLCACSPNVDQSTADPTATANPSDTSETTQEATPEPTPEPTPTVAPEEIGRTVIEDFQQGEPAELLTSTDWSTTTYGITNPELSITHDGTDVLGGLKVVLPDSKAWCQCFSVTGNKVTSAFSAANAKYIRIWVNNQTGGTLGIAITAYGDGAAYMDVEQAVLTGANGIVKKTELGDPSGMGQGKNSAVIVPSGFQGWIAYDLSSLAQRWNETLLTDVTGINKLLIDVRPSSFSQDDFYILDGICLTDSAAGNTRAWEDPNADEEDTDLPKTTQIANGFINATNTTPELHEMPEFNPTGQYSGIKAVWFDGMNRNGKKTKVFAYVGFPKNASADNKVPAIVLVHGGGGHAFLQWVKMWNDRGYAAIAMDNTGYFPTKVNAGSTETNGDWRYGIPRDLKEDGYTNAPNNDDLNSSSGKVSNMWMYHAVGQTILASNILRADERVDGQVGVTGISWGGLITSIVMGYDDRFSFAIPIYCTGYPLENEWGNMFVRYSRDNGTAELWLPESRYDKVTMPVLWLCWNDDGGLYVKSNSLSYLDGVKNNPDTRLSMQHKMFHSHSCGWAPIESMAFADSVTKGTAKLTAVEDNSSGKNINLTLTADSSATSITATLYYLTKAPTTKQFNKYGNYEGTFIEESWNTAELTVEGNTVTGAVPSDAKSYYVEIKTTIGGKQYVTSSTYVELG